MNILKRLAIDSDRFFNRAGFRDIRLRKSKMEIEPRPLISRQGVEAVENLVSEFGGEYVDTWEVIIPQLSLESLFGLKWLDAVAPHQMDWQLKEGDRPWRNVRVVGQPQTGEGGRVVFKLQVLGFEVESAN